MPLPPYCSVGLSTDSDRHPVDREKDTTTANSLMGATETSKMEEGKSKMEAVEHSKMGGKSEGATAKMEEDKAMMEATAKMEEKSKTGEKSKMATTANSMMETNSKMEEVDKSKSSQQE
ncbi:unnamed protein product [Meloidogyne enterolobii]|uniref:Uncharacterized protein n=1 Tax=Meloidogyne enterolobii TaxID=390850 RepID=A0ACB1AVP3_MELEN